VQAYQRVLCKGEIEMWRPKGFDAGRIRDEYDKAHKPHIMGVSAWERGLVEATADAFLEALKKQGQYHEDETATNREGLGHTTPGWQVWIPEEH
jgi:hypothetical protein